MSLINMVLELFLTTPLNILAKRHNEDDDLRK